VLTDHQEEVIRRLAQISVYTFALLVVVGLFTDNVGGLLVGAGFLGIVVGMAARQTLGAILAGFVLMFSRPFEVGDWVEIGDHEGTVTEISIMSTRLRSFDGEVITLPNDDVRSGSIIDRSRRNRYRIEIEVGLDYDTDIERAATVIEETTTEVEDVAAMPEPNAVTKRFGDSAVVLGLRYWIRNPSMRKRWRTQTAAMNAIKPALDEEDRDPLPAADALRAGCGRLRPTTGRVSRGARGDARRVPLGRGRWLRRRERHRRIGESGR